MIFAENKSSGQNKTVRVKLGLGFDENVDEATDEFDMSDEHDHIVTNEHDCSITSEHDNAKINIDQSTCSEYDDANDDIGRSDERQEETADQTALSKNRGQGKFTRQVRLPSHLNNYVLLTYKEIKLDKDRIKWDNAMKDELNSLNKNKTWKIVDVKEVTGSKILSNK